LDDRGWQWLEARKPKIVEGKPKFDQPETEAVAERMLKLAKLQKKGEFKPNREVDVLSTTIGSKEHRGCVRRVSSKLSIRDGFEKDRARYRSHDRYKQEIVAAAESAMDARFKDLFFCNSRGAAAVGPTYDSCLPRGGAATDGGHAPTSTWPSEFGMCTE